MIVFPSAVTVTLLVVVIPSAVTVTVLFDVVEVIRDLVIMRFSWPRDSTRSLVEVTLARVLVNVLVAAVVGGAVCAT